MCVRLNLKHTVVIDDANEVDEIAPGFRRTHARYDLLLVRTSKEVWRESRRHVLGRGRGLTGDWEPGILVGRLQVVDLLHETGS